MERTSKVLAYKSDVWSRERFKKLKDSLTRIYRRHFIIFIVFVAELSKYSKCLLRSKAVSRALGTLGGHPDQRARRPGVLKEHSSVA